MHIDDHRCLRSDPRCVDVEREQVRIHTAFGGIGHAERLNDLRVRDSRLGRRRRWPGRDGGFGRGSRGHDTAGLVRQGEKCGIGRSLVVLRLHHEERACALATIDDKLRAIRAPPAVAARAVHDPAEAIFHRGMLDVVLEDEVNRLGLQHSHVVEHAAIQDHLAQPLVVANRPEKAMPAEAQRGLGRDAGTVGARHQYARTRLAVDLAEATDLCSRYVEVRVGHLKRPEQPFLQDDVERLSGEGFEVAAENVEPHAVAVAGAGLEHERLRRHGSGEVLECRAWLRHGLIRHLRRLLTAAVPQPA